MGFIRDSIHGDLELTPYELRILDTKEMQRLRRIKQLGFTNLIYPGANHTRFEHSIGTMYLAGKLGNNLNLNEDTIELLRTTALLHDIGHAPFSHVSERVLKTKHEEISKQIIKNSTITDIIKEKFTTKEIIKTLSGQTSYGQIISGELDVDRMDYLKRDSHYTGVAYGVIDIERLMYTLELTDNNLTLKPKGVQAAESTLLARYFMYPSVYQHHTTRIVNSMFRVCLKTLLEENIIKEKELTYFDEVELIHTAQQTPGTPQQIINDIQDRKLYKKAKTLNISELENPEKTLNTPQSEIEKIQIEIAEKMKIKPKEIILDLPEVPTLKEMSINVTTKQGLQPLSKI